MATWKVKKPIEPDYIVEFSKEELLAIKALIGRTNQDILVHKYGIPMSACVSLEKFYYSMHEVK